MADARWPISRCRNNWPIPRDAREEREREGERTVTAKKEIAKKCFRFRVDSGFRDPRSASPSQDLPCHRRQGGWQGPGSRESRVQLQRAGIHGPCGTRQGTVIPQCSRTRPQRRERERGQRRHRRRKSELLSRAGAARNRRVDKETSICVSPATASPHRTPIRMLPSADPCQCPTARM